MYADFIWVSADQLFNQVGKMRHMFGGDSPVPYVLRIKIGTGTGYGSQHSMDPAGILATASGWRIIAPSTPYDYIGLINTALTLNDPVAVLEHDLDLYSSMGEVPVEFVPDELGFPIEIADITLTECIMLSGFAGSAERAPQYTRGYGLTFGHNERKAMSMAIVDRALRHAEVGEAGVHAVQDEEFVLYHSDNVEASGFVQHLKLPHYVDFQAELQFVRRLKKEWEEARANSDTSEFAEAAE
jgi:hypothetical protein